MIKLLKSNERGNADHGWLKSRHTFSFADYYEPKRMGYRSLRVINEDRIAGGTGFGAHPHRSMEIISYVMEGALSHQDSLGNKAFILPGEVQRMSAGTGVTHSEQNARDNEEAHFFQIWIMPRTQGGAPGYGQKSFEAELNSKPLVLVVSPDGRDGSIAINQDANLYISRLKAGGEVELPLAPGRGGWIQVVKGRLHVNGMDIEAGDALNFENESRIGVRAQSDAEFLYFDLL